MCMGTPPKKIFETRKAGMSRVCVKASAAFGRRRLHTNTDYVSHPVRFIFSSENGF